MKAAVLRAVQKPLEIEDVQPDSDTTLSQPYFFSQPLITQAGFFFHLLKKPALVGGMRHASNNVFGK